MVHAAWIELGIHSGWPGYTAYTLMELVRGGDLFDRIVARGRYRATVYCLRRFGSSETAWAIGPDTPLDQLPITDDSVTLRLIIALKALTPS